ncbi:MAG: Ig-like domain-containing protein [Gemmatimonadota bacterium]
MRLKRTISVTSVVGLAMLTGACGTAEVASKPIQPLAPAPIVQPSAVLVTFDSSYVRVGSTAQATAIPLDAAGDATTGRGTAVWSVEGNPGVATVSDSGKITTLAPGVAVIVARIDGIRGEDAIVVRPAPALAHILVSLDSTTLLAGSSTAARAVLLDALDDAVSARPVTWEISDGTSVATIAADGRVTALAPGMATVRAAADGVVGIATLDVVAAPVARAAVVAKVVVTLDEANIPLGGSTNARFQALDSTGALLPGKTVTWTANPIAAVATVSAVGLVTAVGVGSATIVGTVDQVGGSARLSVTDTTTRPPTDSAYVPALVQLPNALRDSVVATYPVVTGHSITVRAGDDLQRALDAAHRGDELVLQAGAVFTGTFTLPAKPGSAEDGWILVRSERQSSLPPFGTRVGPADAAMMPRLATSGATAALQTASGASGWWITGLELTIAPGFSSINYGLVLLGDGSGRQNSLALVPSDLVLDRVYIHAHANVGTSRCVALNSARTAIVNSYLDECHLKGYDSQAIAGWNGPGPFRIENNALYGAGENVMFGGSDPAIPGLIPSDIIVRRNHVYTPVEWRMTWTKKNLLETKNVQRLLVEENVFDGSWADAQVGYAFVLKSANQGGRCTWCTSRDITFRYNLIRNVGAGFNLTGREGSNPYPVGELMSRILIEQNVMEDIAIAPFTGDGRIIQLLQNLSQLTIRNNSFTTSSSTLGQFLNIGSTPATTGFSFTHNIVTRGRYGMFSSISGEGAKSLNNVRTPVEFKDIVVITTQRPSGYPIGTTFVGSLDEARLIPSLGADEARVRAIARLVVIP